MRIRDVMTTNVKTCRPSDSLDAAAQLMWEADCGCVPVVDAGERVVGMITDRDVAMAAFFQGVPLRSSAVKTAMAATVLACRPDDDVSVAAETMRANRVRRLPVIDERDVLVGIVSLNDLARAAGDGVSRDVVARTFAGICEPRTAPPTAGSPAVVPPVARSRERKRTIVAVER
jgi:CBS domain-containing protein